MSLATASAALSAGVQTWRLGRTREFARALSTPNYPKLRRAGLFAFGRKGSLPIVGTLTDLNLRSLLNSHRTGEELIPDGSVPGLSIRLFPGGPANWTFLARVAGEGGVNHNGKRLLGKKLRISLGNYPEVTL